MTLENKEIPISLASRIKRAIDKFNPNSRTIDDWPAGKKQSGNPQFIGVFKEATGKSLSEIIFPDDY